MMQCNKLNSEHLSTTGLPFRNCSSDHLVLQICKLHANSSLVTHTTNKQTKDQLLDIKISCSQSVFQRKLYNNPINKVKHRG